jgi:hypothetical protein
MADWQVEVDEWLDQIENDVAYASGLCGDGLASEIMEVLQRIEDAARTAFNVAMGADE